MIKISILYTGGTFGSDETAAGKVISGKPDVVDLYARLNPGSAIEFDECSLDKPVSSENMTIKLWNVLIAALKKLDFSAYDGIIITHGTDTLAYSAALLSILLGHVRIPVILVSSNEPLSSPAANGYKNFEDAVSFINTQHGGSGGVYVFYSYNLRDTEVYLARDIVQSQPFINRYTSYDGSRFGTMKNGRFCPYNADAARRLMGRQWNDGPDILTLLPELKNCILLITPYVGLDYSRFNLNDSSIKALLHTTYHSFSMCVDGGTSSAEYLLQTDTGRRNIPLYFSSFDDSVKLYESTRYMLKKGARFIVNSSVELAYARLVVGYSIDSGYGLSDEIQNALGICLLTES